MVINLVPQDKIVTLSLICLRTCLEVLRSLPESLDYTSHRACTWGKCVIKSIETLETYLKMFLTESSRVFFKKDNLRSRTWWLSMFYGLCIQSMVRRGLIAILEYYPWKKRTRHYAIKEYLHIALRLFAATSGTYDPLMKNYAANDPLAFLKTKEEKTRDQNFKVAQQVVKQENWAFLSISGSMQFLRNLFQDKEEALPSNGYSPYPPHSGTEAPYNYAASAQQQVQQRQHQIPKPTDSIVLRLEALIAIATSQDN